MILWFYPWHWKTEKYIFFHAGFRMRCKNMLHILKYGVQLSVLTGTFVNYCGTRQSNCKANFRVFPFDFCLLSSNLIFPLIIAMSYTSTKVPNFQFSLFDPLILGLIMVTFFMEESSLAYLQLCFFKHSWPMYVWEGTSSEFFHFKWDKTGI